MEGASGNFAERFSYETLSGADNGALTEAFYDNTGLAALYEALAGSAAPEIQVTRPILSDTNRLTDVAPAYNGTVDQDALSATIEELSETVAKLSDVITNLSDFGGTFSELTQQLTDSLNRLADAVDALTALQDRTATTAVSSAEDPV